MPVEHVSSSVTPGYCQRVEFFQLPGRSYRMWKHKLTECHGNFNIEGSSCIIWSGIRRVGESPSHCQWPGGSGKSPSLWSGSFQSSESRSLASFFKFKFFKFKLVQVALALALRLQVLELMLASDCGRDRPPGPGRGSSFKSQLPVVTAGVIVTAATRTTAVTVNLTFNIIMFKVAPGRGCSLSPCRGRRCTHGDRDIEPGAAEETSLSQGCLFFAVGQKKKQVLTVLEDDF